jgi:hypothetical protein
MDPRALLPQAIANLRRHATDKDEFDWNVVDAGVRLLQNDVAVRDALLAVARERPLSKHGKRQRKTIQRWRRICEKQGVELEDLRSWVNAYFDADEGSPEQERAYAALQVLGVTGTRGASLCR